MLSLSLQLLVIYRGTSLLQVTGVARETELERNSHQDWSTFLANKVKKQFPASVLCAEGDMY